MPRCRECGEEIKFIQQVSGTWIPVNPESINFNDCERDITLITEDGERVRVDTEKRYQPYEEGYPIHFEFCNKKKDRFFEK